MTLPDTKPYVGKRVAATLIDYTLMFIFTAAIFYLLGHPNDEGGYTITGIPAFTPMIIWFFYFVFAEFFLGGTLGHQLLNLKVMSTDSSTPTFGQTFLRRISDALEITWCFGLIAFILTKNTEHNQRLGDIWAKTIVIGKHDIFPHDKFDFETT